MINSPYFQISSGQMAVMHYDAGVSLANCRYPIIVLHGHAGDATTTEEGALVDQNGWLTALARAGFVVIGIDAGGPATWSDPAAMSAVDAAYSYTSRSKVGLLGYSMGGLVALNWIKRNTTKVKCALLIEPCTDLTWAYTDPYSAGWTTEINNDFGSYGATAGYRVSDEYSTWSGVGFPIHVIQASDDTVVPLSQSQAFVTGVNDPNITLRTPYPTGNHTGVFANIPASEVTAFFDSAQ